MHPIFMGALTLLTYSVSSRVRRGFEFLFLSITYCSVRFSVRSGSSALSCSRALFTALMTSVFPFVVMIYIGAAPNLSTILSESCLEILPVKIISTFFCLRASI